MFCRHVFGNISGGFRGISCFFGNFAGFRGNTWISRVRDRAKYQKPCLEEVIKCNIHVFIGKNFVVITWIRAPTKIFLKSNFKFVFYSFFIPLELKWQICLYAPVTPSIKPNLIPDKMGKGYTPFHTEMAQKGYFFCNFCFVLFSSGWFISLPFAVGEKIFEVSFTCKRGIEGVSVFSGLNLEKL